MTGKNKDKIKNWAVKIFVGAILTGAGILIGNYLTKAAGEYFVKPLKNEKQIETNRMRIETVLVQYNDIIATLDSLATKKDIRDLRKLIKK